MSEIRADWYPDPENSSQLRYWDGQVWTDNFAPIPSGVTTPQAPVVAEPVVQGSIVEQQVEVPVQVENLTTDQVAQLILDGPPKTGMFTSKKEKDSLKLENLAIRQWASAFKLEEHLQRTEEVARLTEQKISLQTEVDSLSLMISQSKEVISLEEQKKNLGIEIQELRKSIVETREELILQEAGVYNYRSELESAVDYQVQIAAIKEQVKAFVKSGNAVAGVSGWTVNGSVAQGNKMVKEFSKLMLRAYNAEADDAIKNVKPSNLKSKVDRLCKTVVTISKLGATMGIHVDDEYHRLRVKELDLTADYRAKVEAEKELEREEKARMREEAKLLKEIEREEEKFRKEMSHYESAIKALREAGNIEAAEEKERELKVIEENMASLEDRKSNIRVGYVYVISNIGAFGEKMVKIGMTRRLEPLDRVRELGDASVPFRYDVHALIFSQDAVSLETRLHQKFAEQRVNFVNNRREFFYVTPAEVKSALEEIHNEANELTGDVLSFEEWAEAEEFRISESERTKAKVSV